MTEHQVILQRQEKEQQDKVTASLPDKKRLTELEKQVKHLKKGKEYCAHAQGWPWSLKVLHQNR